MYGSSPKGRIFSSISSSFFNATSVQKVLATFENLDHVLYDKRNSTDEEKEEDAYAFAKKYKNNVIEFMRFMCESAFSVKSDFKESWEFIEADSHSIEKYTNLPSCLEEEMKKKEEADT